MLSGGNSDATEDAASRGRRAQTETVGFVLAFGIVIVGALIVVTLSATTFTDTEDRLSEDRAQKALTQFDSKAALVALGEADTHRVSFAFEESEQFTLQEDNGWMNVTATNRSTENTREIMNATLGALVYENGDRRLAYQGGGVWRADDEGGQMISSPEFHYRGATLTLPTITLTGESSVGRSERIRRVSTEQKFPRPGDPNPLEDHIVTVTVGSEFYRGWGEYFETRTDGEVSYDHDNEEVTLTLVSPIGEINVESAVAGQVSSGNLLFQANPTHPCHKGGNPKPPYFDSYNSSDGSYCSQYDENEVNSAGEIIFGGKIETQAAAGQIQGDLVAGGETSLFHNQALHGNVSHTDGCSGCDAAQDNAEKSNPSAAPPGGYTINKINGISGSPSIGFTIESTLRNLQRSNSPTTINAGDELTAGEYYTEEITLNGGDAVFNTTGGDITIGVNNTIDLTSGGQIRVIGDGQVDIYVNGSSGDDLSIDGHDSGIFAPDDNGTKLTVLGKQDFTATLNRGTLTGVIYAPGGQTGDAEIEMFRGATVYGGLVTGDMTIGNPGGGTIHYDRDLEDKQIVPPDRSIVRLTYLHVTENEISFGD
jgi:hypothetical protein